MSSIDSFHLLIVIGVRTQVSHGNLGSQNTRLKDVCPLKIFNNYLDKTSR